jgi:hypothetical protein
MVARRLIQLAFEKYPVNRLCRLCRETQLMISAEDRERFVFLHGGKMLYKKKREQGHKIVSKTTREYSERGVA